METAAPRRSPGNVVPPGGRSLTTKEIDSQSIAGRRRATVNCSIRNSHRPIPHVSSLIDPRCDLEIRIPFPTAVVMLAIEIDIQIDPLPLRRNLEFFVPFYVLEIRADERFRDIPIPKLVRLSRRIRIRRQVKFFVGTYEKKVEVLFRPARSDLGPIFRLSFAERI